MIEPPPGSIPLRLAVVGAGPTALFALEALTASLPATDDLGGAARAGRGGALEVTVIDPAADPGTGTAYDLSQPPYLRLNSTATTLEAPAGGAVPSLPAWMSREHPALEDDPYPPRAIVGAYLIQRWERMLDALTRHGAIQHVRGRAVSVQRAAERWLVEVTGPDAQPSLLGPFDEVLLATGHATGHRDGLAPSWTARAPLRPSVFPVRAMLGPGLVPAGSRVAVRGGALTFIDAALALTEGRGGTFRADSSRTGATVHVRGAGEPSVILPTTRHGLLPNAKPDPRLPLPPATVHAGHVGKERLRASADPCGVLDVDTVLDVVTSVAAAMLITDDLSLTESRRAVQRTLADGAEPDLPTRSGRAEAALRRSVAVAEGSRPPGAAWALGRTWSLLYPMITAGLRGTDASPADWARFRGSARVLERFAFGPPLVNARKLLAMVDSAAVDLSWVDAGSVIDAEGIHGVPSGATKADLVIDAVLAPPGVIGITDELTASLLATGIVTVRPGRRGAVVDVDGTPLGADGSRATGLALIGRATEDHVIGHDTLNRHLHTEIDLWAARIADLPRHPRCPRRPRCHR